MPGRVIETARLLLRQLAADDLDALAAMDADPEVMRFIGDGSTAGREEVAAMIERRMREHEAHDYGLQAVVERETGCVIGRCGRHERDIEFRGDVARLFSLSV